ncbi:MAG: pantothenate kinase [Acidimicrobiales bacterium]|jgi:type I pantothenate kinase|nr:pantothenate kinase [Acidimicrobiales bacterium]
MSGATPSNYQRFSRDEWSRLRAAIPMTLDESDLAELRGINEQLSLDEVADVYLPLSRLLNLYVAATQQLHTVTHAFLGSPVPRVPYVIGVAGSVAVGKSTTARVLQALLARWPDHPRVDLVTTDGFLHPNRILDERGLMGRKGFPESYDLRRLLAFLAAVKGGAPEVAAPVYSHHAYDIVPGEQAVVRSPDVLIVEGLNVLQGGNGPVVSDYFDFSVYVDAEESDVEHWYVERFLTLRDTAFRDETAFFHRFAGLSTDEAVATAKSIWHDINGVNLSENILPTRERAHLIIEKGSDHRVAGVQLRRL